MSSHPRSLSILCYMGVYFGIDNKNMMYVLYRDCLSTRKHSGTHVAKTTGKAIPSPYAFGLVPAFA